MTDQEEKILADETAEEEVSGETSPVSEPKATPEDFPEEETEETPESQETSEEEVREEKQRPSRLVRRIWDLSSKLKERATEPKKETGVVPPVGEALSETLGISEAGLPWRETPSVYPGAEISPEEYERAVAQRAAGVAELRVRQIISQYEAANRQRETLKSFADDLDSLVREESVLNKNSPEYDEVVDAAFTELVEAVNKNERGEFQPKMAASEIWKQFSKALKRERSKGEESVTTKMVEHAATSAVPVSGKSGKQLTSEEEIAEALDRGELTAEEAEKILPKIDRWY